MKFIRSMLILSFLTYPIIICLNLEKANTKKFVINKDLKILNDIENVKN
jgi:hypothetical protein